MGTPGVEKLRRESSSFSPRACHAAQLVSRALVLVTKYLEMMSNDVTDNLLAHSCRLIEVSLAAASHDQLIWQMPLESCVTWLVKNYRVMGREALDDCCVLTHVGRWSCTVQHSKWSSLGGGRWTMVSCFFTSRSQITFTLSSA